MFAVRRLIDADDRAASASIVDSKSKRERGTDYLTPLEERRGEDALAQPAMCSIPIAFMSATQEPSAKYRGADPEQVAGSRQINRCRDHACPADDEA